VPLLVNFPPHTTHTPLTSMATNLKTLNLHIKSIPSTLETKVRIYIRLRMLNNFPLTGFLLASKQGIGHDLSSQSIHPRLCEAHSHASDHLQPLMYA
jgi:hypothetical protein